MGEIRVLCAVLGVKYVFLLWGCFYSPTQLELPKYVRVHTWVHPRSAMGPVGKYIFLLWGHFYSPTWLELPKYIQVRFGSNLGTQARPRDESGSY